MFSIVGKERFVLLVGEHGAILSLFIGKKLHKRLYAPGTSVSDRREFNALFQQYHNAPLSLLLDIMDQNYSQQSFPAVSVLAIDKLVKKRMERDFDPNDINGAISLGREEDGRKDWKYLLVSVTRTEIVSDWVDYIVSLPNPFQGIYLLPLETASMAKRLPLVDKEGKAEQTNWQLIVSHHKVSGIRQTIIYKGKTLFSRLIMQGKENMPELLAGFIEQETLNTIEYLGRLSFSEESKLNITIVVSEEIKQHLSQNRIQDHYVEVLTPNEIAKALGYNEISEKNDKFSDIFFAAHFLNSKPALKLNTKTTSRLSMMSAGLKYSTILVTLLIPPLVVLPLYTLYEVYSTNSKIKTLENDKAQIEAQWKTVQNASDYDIDESSKITEIVGIHTKISDITLSPNPLFRRFQDTIKKDAIAKSIQWSYSHSFDAENSISPRINAKFDLEYINIGDNVDNLFGNFESFSRRLKQQFNEYDVSHTKLPEKITLGEKAQVINMQVTISTKLDNRR